MEPGRAGHMAAAVAAAKRWGPLVFVFVALTLAIWQGWFPTLEQVADHRDRLVDFVEQRYFQALAIFVVLYVVIVALSIPGAVLLTMVGGFLFGWLIAAFFVVLAATAGATAIFIIVRTSLGRALAEKAGPRLDRLRDGFQRDALSYLLFLRLVPIFPFWLVNIAPALLGMRVGQFIIGTFVGIIPGTVAFAFLGAGLDSVIAAQRAAYISCLARQAAANSEAGASCEFELDPGSLLTAEVAAALAALGVVALIPVAARYIAARRRN